MKELIRKSWIPWTLAISLVLLIFYFLTRLVNLTVLPIFTDEAIYIRWSQIGSRDANWRFISMTDGKQPLFTWIMMILLRIFPMFDPLFTGRLVSVIAGFGSLVGIWFLSYELFNNRRLAFITSFLYLILPFTLMYDRMALYDSLTACCSIWSLLLSILLVKHVRLDIALLLGMSVGLGVLNKSSGIFSLYLLPFTMLLFNFKVKKPVKRLLKWIGLAVISSLLSQIIYSVLRLSPFFHVIGQKDLVFLYSFSDWLTHPFQFLEGNLKGLFDWLITYLTKPVFIVSLLPLIIFWKFPREKLLLLIYWLAPFIALALFAKVLYPRFVLFMSVPLILLAALSIEYLVQLILDRSHAPITKYLTVILILGIIFPSIKTSYLIVTDILHAPIPLADRGQYIDDWPSGWGVKEVVKYLEIQSKKGPLVVYTDGTFGLFLHSLEIYLVDNPNIKIKGIWPIHEEMPIEMISDIEEFPTYLVMNKTEENPKWNLNFIAKYQKGLRNDRSLRLFQVLPSKETPL